MFFAIFPFHGPTVIQVIHISCLFVAGNAPFALIVLHDAKKRNVRSRAGRLFAVITLLTNLLGMVAYMSYVIATRSKMPEGTREALWRPGTLTLVIEVSLAAFIITLFYLVVKRVILLSEF